MEPEHLRLKMMHSQIHPEDELMDSAMSPAPIIPTTPATDATPMHIGAANAR